MCIQRCSKDMLKFDNYAHSYTSTYINKSSEDFISTATTSTAMATMSMSMTTPSIWSMASTPPVAGGPEGAGSGGAEGAGGGGPEGGGVPEGAGENRVDSSNVFAA